jgi:hypothetical protein
LTQQQKIDEEEEEEESQTLLDVYLIVVNRFSEVSFFSRMNNKPG